MTQRKLSYEAPKLLDSWLLPMGLSILVQLSAEGEIVDFSDGGEMDNDDD